MREPEREGDTRQWQAVAGVVAVAVAVAMAVAAPQISKQITQIYTWQTGAHILRIRSFV